jgi:valyl-tRNA synthetase
MKITLDKGYEPKSVEEKWFKEWLASGLFHAREDDGKPPYSIVIPPPNVTGSLHMGHALNNTLQDILARWRRMRGDSVLWVVGTDHAGIATQNVVEKDLAKQGTSREELGREAFVERVWEWRREYGGRIIHQLQRLGCSCDWERERFTMDEGLSKAVREVFVRLYEEGLIYRGDYIINWCPRCRTALSDLEVEYEDTAGHLWRVRYPIEGGDGFIEVATTRPETILGDTAVAFHPDDERYRSHLGGASKAVLPVLGRVIPVLPDSFVDPAFGTGAVKITPAHDPNDYEMSLRHGLPALMVIGEDGVMTAAAGPYAGLDRFECRRRIVEDLTASGALVGVDDHRHAVGHCYRCRTVIEPYLSKQWFVRAKPLADPAIRAVETGAIRIVPAAWEKTYFEWMNNIRDWCISRQIWWGHRIPAWYCDGCGEVVVSREDVTACPKCGGGVTREKDVLDTWFSSALWPFSTMGWPEKTPLLEKYYPTTVLVTAFDILFFWVARMIMMGLKFMGDVPFRDVYIHALVRDAEGQKMSKSKGNVVDPLLIMEKYGTDAFRFSLAAFAAQGRDVKLSEDRIEGYRHFANKIWNASRFVLMNFEEGETHGAPVPGQGETADRWILSRLAGTAAEMNEALAAYRFNDAASAAYRFVWHELCDWYLELAKIRLYGGDPSEAARVRGVLLFVLERSLRLLHPFMPFLTEEIWRKLPGSSGSIMETVFPDADNLVAYRSAETEADMAVVMETVSALRTVRGEMNVSPALKVTALLRPLDGRASEDLSRHLVYIRSLAGASELTVDPSAQRPKGAASAVTSRVEVFVPLGGLMDLAQEKDRINKNMARIEKDLVSVEKRLGNPDFLSRAKPEVVAEERARLAEAQTRMGRLRENLRAVEEALG